MTPAAPATRLGDRQRRDWLRLIRTPNVGPASFRGLIDRFGSAEAALEMLPALMQSGGLGRDARITLAVADVFHQDHPDTRIVFVADLTAWLSTQKGTRWADLDVDIYEAMHVFDEHGLAALRRRPANTLADGDAHAGGLALEGAQHQFVTLI